MNTEEEEKESVKSKQHLNIPEGALVIMPMRNRVLFPSMMMPAAVRSPPGATLSRRRFANKCRLDLSFNAIRM